MEQMTKQTQTQNTESGGRVAKRVIGAIFGVVEIILAFRLVFKLFGAEAGNGFVSFIYDITNFVVGLFEGIFAKVGNFEPATLIAMIIVAVIAWIIMIVMTPRKSTRSERTEYTGPADHSPK